jgi:hypothetical protein
LDLNSAEPCELLADAARILGDAKAHVDELYVLISKAQSASAAAARVVGERSTRDAEKAAPAGLSVAHARIQLAQMQVTSITTHLEAARHRVGIARTRAVSERDEGHEQ